MFNFFVDKNNCNDGRYYISGADFNHIKNVLRMKIGDKFLISCDGKSDLCQLETYEAEAAIAQIVEENYSDNELPIRIHLFQGLPKSDKMELIIQKCVELGVSDITPVEMSRCVVKLEEKKKSSKQTRWQAIAESAAKQSKRNVVPTVHSVIPFSQAIKSSSDIMIIPYENEDGMAATVSVLKDIKHNMTVGIFIGPEGGFDEKEIELARENSGRIISLGKRILRTETAAITTVGMCMLYAETELNGDL
ncbi:MAG: 16S rRNA (uracil(1498)-N(3))-methyltransferase [Clostridia bacterium]|nr:16S rRNA (uracil(1498)-N(3))-methyltransferase [Clostridia bacterium]